MKFLIVFAALLAYAYSEKIVNGYATTIGTHPYQISLRSTGSHICGGSILNKRWVITAAHCVYGGTASKYTILHASTNRVVASNDNRIRQVNLIVIHPSFNYNTLNNDIALLRVSSDFDLASANADPIELNADKSATNLINQNCWVSGWGTLKSGSSSLPDVLQAVQMPIITQSQSVYTGASGYNDLTMLIAGKPNEGKDSCQGDSGGPLAIKRNNKWILAGLTSWGNDCGKGGVYTRVSTYVDWVNEKLKQYGN